MHTLFLRCGISNRTSKITAITRISTNFKLLQVPFSFNRYPSVAYILMSRYLLFKSVLLFSLARTYKRLVQHHWGFPRLCRYSETFLRNCFTPVHTQSMPRSRDAASTDENWTLTERRVRHLERTVPGRYLLSHHTMINRTYWNDISKTNPSTCQLLMSTAGTRRFLATISHQLAPLQIKISCNLSFGNEIRVRSAALLNWRFDNFASDKYLIDIDSWFLLSGNISR